MPQSLRTLLTEDEFLSPEDAQNSNKPLFPSPEDMATEIGTLIKTRVLAASPIGKDTGGCTQTIKIRCNSSKKHSACKPVVIGAKISPHLSSSEATAVQVTVTDITVIVSEQLGVIGEK